MSDLSLIEKSVFELSPDATLDQYLELDDRLDFMSAAIRDLKKRLNEAGVAILERTGPTRVGDTIYRVNVDRQKKARKKPAEFAKDLMEQLGGDWDAFTRCLKSDAFKPGQTSIELESATGDEKAAEAFFEVKERKSVEGTAVKQVVGIPVKVIRKA